MTSPGEEIIVKMKPKLPEDNTSDTGEATNQDDLAAEWESMVGDQENAAEADSGGSDASRVLNQDEIDSLLGLSDVGEGGDGTGLHTILNSGLVSSERLPMLEVVFDRLVRMLSTSLRNFYVRQCRGFPRQHR